MKLAFYRVKWVRQSLMFCGLLAAVAGCYVGGTRLHQYGQEQVVVEREKMRLYVKLMNKPAWLNKAILDRIAGETEAFVCRDVATYGRLTNPLDKEILAEVAANYANHPARRENGWMKRIVEVRRVVDPNGKSQTIEIYAEYRRPVAWVSVNEMCYLVDEEMVRLPNAYSQADRKAVVGLMAMMGVEERVPEVGERFEGEDLSAGLKLVELLRDKKYASQIDVIDVSNFAGRSDEKASWIVLKTVWPGRVVLWGRTPGEEKFWEISTAAKLKVLDDIEVKFKRIDAGRDYVDIRRDQPWVPISGEEVTR